MKEIPLTSSGKVNRKGLPAPEWEQVRGGGEYVGAETEIEELLVGIWGEVLKLERVGVHDNFFNLGGHSLLATQVIASIRTTFGVDVPLRALFEAPTIAALAPVLRNLQTGPHPATPLPELKSISRERRLRLSYAQQRLWFLNRIDPQSPFYNVPTAFRIRGPVRISELRRSFEAIVQRHEILRTAFPLVDGQPVQRIYKTAPLDFEVTELDNVALPERESRALELAGREAIRPFDLARIPLMRVRIFKLGTEDYLTAVTMHHIVTDGWSMGLLIDEVSTFYRLFSDGSAAAPEQLPVQFADFAEWERQWVEGPAMQSRLQYWRAQLGGELPVLHWPSSLPAPQQRTFTGQQLIRVLPDELRNKLHEISRHENVTFYMTLLAAYQTLLWRFSTKDEVIVGSPVSNRYFRGAEKLIGCFINLRLLRTSLSGAPTFRELLHRVRKATLEAEANDLPFDQIVQNLQSGRSPAHSPFYQTTLTLQNTPLVHMSEFQGISVSPLDLPTGTTQCDLVLVAREIEAGMELTVLYSTDIFTSTTAQQLINKFQNVLTYLSENLDLPLNSAAMLAKPEKEKLLMEKRGKFMVGRQSGINLAKQELIKTGELRPGQKLPLLITPRMDDVDLVEWGKLNFDFLEEQLKRAGGILFRGFAIRTAEDFQRFSASLYARTMKYRERSTPRTEIGKDIYTSTEYPAEETIAMHNEFSYGTTWPMKIWFFCEKAATKGGQTPIADSRQVFALIDPKVRERFIEKKVMYIRNYGMGIDLSWQTVFQTDSREEVEKYCREAPIIWEWLEGDRLRTRQIREAVAEHPRTGEMLWFNQAHLFHLSNLSPHMQKSLVETFGEENLPRQARYGDGSPIEEEALDEVRRAYAKATVEFDWQPGDVLLLDNMLVAHGRRPFQGTRRILVSMAEPCSIEVLKKAESVTCVS
jgi:alpha-ketoglutarate-dependent taurine dioxygenase